MDNQLLERLNAQDQKLEQIYLSTEKTRKYLLIIMGSSLAMIVLPVIFAALILPLVISSYSSALGGLI